MKSLLALLLMLAGTIDREEYYNTERWGLWKFAKWLWRGKPADWIGK